MQINHQPHASRRSPVLANNGVVATSQPLAAQAGLRVLQQGGNAVDAAIATAAALTVVEPTSNGIGSDAFALVWDGAKLHGLNGSGRWPAALSSEALRAEGHAAMPDYGWLSVSVPGAPAAWDDLHGRFGRTAMAELLAPAIDYAENGFPLSPVVSELWSNATATYLGSGDPALAGWAEYFAKSGQAPRAGQICFSPGHAACLRGLAERGLRDFYEGAVAERILSYSGETGGHFAAEDLARHSSEWVEPIGMAYKGHELWEIPPNGQGIAALIALGILDGSDVGDHPQISAEAWHLQIEAMKLAFADTYRYVADQEHAEVPVSGLLDPGYLAARRALIGDAAATPPPGKPPRGGTVYLCTADRDGMMVSFIQSNYHGFGSGVVIPDLGLSFQNRASGFTLEAGHPNEAQGGKRPRHTIIPAFLTKDGQAVGPLGVMGGEMQPQGHLQVVAGMLDHGLNPQAALDASRWMWVEGKQVAVEPGLPEAIADSLRARGHDIVRADTSIGFGRGQIIRRLDNGSYIAGSEPRTDGAAVGW